MAERARARRTSEGLRISLTLAALAGTVPGALLAAICVARFLPLGAEARFVAGFTLAIPFWLAGICLAFLARDGAQAWLWCGALAVALAGPAIGIP